IGYNHPALMEPRFSEKLLRAARFNPSNSDIYTVEMAEFVETFSRVAMPSYLPHLFLVSGGSLAVENALKAAFDWKVKKNFTRGLTSERGHKVIHFRESFHGRSGYALSLTNTADPRKYQYFPRFDWPRIVNPKLTFPLTEQRLMNTMALEKDAEAQIKQAFVDFPDDIAAIILEPIQGEGGDNHFRPEFFRILRDLADENDALLVFDEVQTGLGLTGEMWAHQVAGVQPDVLAFGKKAQVCGIMAGRRIDEVENNVFRESSRINSTWGGNLTDMVRAQKILEIIESENLVDNARIMGEYFMERLTALSERFENEFIFNLRGQGLMIAFDLPDSAARAELIRQAYDRGLFVFGCGTRSIRCRPLLDISKTHIDKAVDILESCIKEMVSTAQVSAF
ncbi:MAG TPA: L-lysine 6-transaminase, partial [Calditrichia bacterium]|nr:L-lysine 6-transaminase [Calditrichia bacterium]